MSDVPLREHLTALRKADLKLHAEIRKADDRRYAEVDVEREKALKIKETADQAALLLAREIQTYKDEKANELRSQIERERGTYATKGDLHAAVEKIEVTLKPLTAYVNGQHGRQAGIGLSTAVLVGAVTLFLALLTYLTRA